MGGGEVIVEGEGEDECEIEGEEGKCYVNAVV